MMAWQLRQLWQHDSGCGSLRGTHALCGSLVRLVAGGSPPPPLGAGGHHHHNGGPGHPHHHSGAHRHTRRPSVCTTEHTTQLEKLGTRGTKSLTNCRIHRKHATINSDQTWLLCQIVCTIATPSICWWLSVELHNKLHPLFLVASYLFAITVRPS